MFSPFIYTISRKLSRFEYDIFGRCVNVGSWFCVRNIYANGIVLSIGCRPSKLHIVLEVSVLPK